MITKTKIVGFHSGHDVSYCILENGIPIIHEELERMTRVKMGEGDGLKLFFQRSNDTNIQYFAFGNYGEGIGGRFEGDFNDKISNDEMKNIIKKITQNIMNSVIIFPMVQTLFIPVILTQL